MNLPFLFETAGSFFVYRLAVVLDPKTILRKYLKLNLGSPANGLSHWLSYFRISHATSLCALLPRAFLGSLMGGDGVSSPRKHKSLIYIMYIIGFKFIL